MKFEAFYKEAYDAEMEELRETLPAEPPVYGDPVTDSGVCLRL